MNTKILTQLEEVAAGADAVLTPAVSLSDYTTLRLGGRAYGLIDCPNARSVVSALSSLTELGLTPLILGGGSNVVVGDSSVGSRNLDLVVLRSSDHLCEIASVGKSVDPFLTGTGAEPDSGADSEAEPGVESGVEQNETVILRAGAGLAWDDLVAKTVADGYGGLECLSGIPGTVGASAVQNIGAYGVEVSDVIHRVQIVNRHSLETAWCSPEELSFGYRSSRLKGTDSGVVTAVEYSLTTNDLSHPIEYGELAKYLGCLTGDRMPVNAVRNAVLELRRFKGMVISGSGTVAGGYEVESPDPDTFSVGSFFTNPVVSDSELALVQERLAKHGVDRLVPSHLTRDGNKLSAAWLIQSAGFSRGYPGSSSPVRLSTRHTLALTTRGDAATVELLSLAREVRDGVQGTSGVELSLEPVLVACRL